MINKKITNFQTHYRTCNLCEAMCGLVITTQNEQIQTIVGDEKDPLSHGHICPKALAYKDLHEDSDRLKFPVKKTNSGWEQISWENALDEIADKLVNIQKIYGNNAVGVYQGNPSVHNYGTLLYGPTFFSSLRTRNKFSASTVDQIPHQFAAYQMLGHQLLVPIPDIDRTQYMIILGGNPLVSNGSLMTAPDIRNRLKAIQSRDGKFVVIDPRRTETAKLADEHCFIQPGTDVYFLIGIIQEIIKNGWIKQGHLDSVTKNLDEFLTSIPDIELETISSITGISSANIQRIAKEFSQAESAVCYGRMGACTQKFGGTVHWLINMVNIITGNFDAPGGAMFTSPAFDTLGNSQTKGHYNKGQSRVRNLPEFAGEYPAVTMADEMLVKGEGQIRAMVTSAGNPILSVPGGEKLDRAFSGLEFMVSIDFYINETTRHADIILPPAFNLNGPHFDVVFNIFAVRDVVKYSNPVFPKEPGTKYDWEIFMGLEKRIAQKNGRKYSKVNHFLSKKFGPEWLLDLGIRIGEYGSLKSLFKWNGLTLSKVKKQVHGVDLGPLKPRFPKRLFTSDKKIDLAPSIFIDDLKRVISNMAHSNANGSLTLIGRRQLRSNNSWMHNCSSLMSGRDRFLILMNPLDAQKKSIADGQKVRVKTSNAQIELEAKLSTEMMPGVISIPHGWGHEGKDTQQRIALENKGGNLNALGDDLAIDPVSGNADLHIRNVKVYPI
ncbi:MAG TPA: molybdopterin oxidoreductase family protein [Candidatus Marinimicrobia bacterium]|nr:molybdopterin oxidoreductase family protein [Candidatus Neomarinimicrobiota bacterium]